MNTYLIQRCDGYNFTVDGTYIEVESAGQIIIKDISLNIVAVIPKEYIVLKVDKVEKKTDEVK